MSTISTPNLGSVITNAAIRKSIYGTYVVLLVIAGALQVYFAATQVAQPQFLVGALAVLAYLGIPVGGLALANAGTPAAVVTNIVNTPAAPVEVDPTPSTAAPQHAITPDV
jgi:hypothetical protein